MFDEKRWEYTFDLKTREGVLLSMDNMFLRSDGEDILCRMLDAGEWSWVGIAETLNETYRLGVINCFNWLTLHNGDLFATVGGEDVYSVHVILAIKRRGVRG